MLAGASVRAGVARGYRTGPHRRRRARGHRDGGRSPGPDQPGQDKRCGQRPPAAKPPRLPGRLPPRLPGAAGQRRPSAADPEPADPEPADPEPADPEPEPERARQEAWPWSSSAGPPPARGSPARAATPRPGRPPRPAGRRRWDAGPDPWPGTVQPATGPRPASGRRRPAVYHAVHQRGVDPEPNGSWPSPQTPGPPQAEDVARRPDLPALGLLRRHETGRANHQPGMREHAGFDRPGDAEIDHPRPVLGQQHVAGFRSRCTTPAAWIALSASASPRARASTDAAGSGPCWLTASASEGPDT